MNKFIATVALSTLFGSTVALADHNSPFGAGWAPDPTGSHTEAVESVDSDMMASAPVDRTDLYGVDVDRVIELRENSLDARTDAVDNMRDSQSETIAAAREEMIAGASERRMR